MSTTLSGQISLATSYTYAQQTNGFADAAVPGSLSKQQAFANGVGAGQCDTIYAAQRTLAANTSETLNISNASLSDQLNLTVNMARVKAVFIQLLSTVDDSTNVSVNCSGITYSGLNGATGFTDGTTPKRRVFSGGADGCFTGSAAGVTAARAITVANEDVTNAAVYRIVVWGGKS